MALGEVFFLSSIFSLLRVPTGLLFHRPLLPIGGFDWHASRHFNILHCFLTVTVLPQHYRA
jgi:hypothetical protein